MEDSWDFQFNKYNPILDQNVQRLNELKNVINSDGFLKRGVDCRFK